MPDSPPEATLPPQPAASQTQPVRIHFPGRFLTARTHGNSSRSSSISFTSPPQHMPQLWSGGGAAADSTRGRRRVCSLGHDPVVSSSRMSKNTPPRYYGSRRKKNPAQKHGPAIPLLTAGSFVSDFEPSAFSDEYDLYPKILQDVQRALHLQSRRRERISQQLHHISDEGPLSNDTPINTSTSCASASAPLPPPDPSLQDLRVASLSSEVDFSPSTRSVSPHPVPLSSNAGATLDWTGSQSEGEKSDKRWSISRGKQKAKEKMLPSSKAVIEKQEALFIDRISRIRAEASPATVRKAAIVSEQLGRRYNILCASMLSNDPVTPVQVARWHASLGTDTQAWLDSAEPLTWLKHLLDRRGKRRSQWHVSALIVEEYVKAKKSITSFTPPPRSPTPSTSLETPLPHYHLKSAVRKITVPPSDSSPATSFSRVRSSGHISFRPFIENSHESLVNPQPRSEGRARRWRHSIPALFDSGGANCTPSPYHHRDSSAGLSPASSRLNFSDIIQRFRWNPAESDEGSSSPFGSQLEDQYDTELSRLHKKNKQKRQSHPEGLQLAAAEIKSNDMPEVHVATPPLVDSTSTPSQVDKATAGFPEGNHVGETLSQPPFIRERGSHRSASLPLVSRTRPVPLGSVGEPDEDGQPEAEYDLRSKTLEELRNHNHRLRHRMQRVAVDVREYELVCSIMMPALGVAYRSLPTELLDAFSHDPSAITSGTRKRHGWRVVEDIHARVLRQREILASFLSEVKTNVDAVSTLEDVLDKPISTLMEKLQELEKVRDPLQEKADEVSQMLNAVRESHSTIKDEFNDTLSYTSVVYPELSQIVALEESYKDQYQQIWELSMDALTFILDTITPFWRNYGKIIGEDMQDFIIIPWYRNEFTGEPKRYPVLFVPRRSLRHWITLFCLCALTCFITFLQARAALTSTWYYRLLWIDNQAFRWAIMPFFWVVILIQWLALTLEVCILLLYITVVVWWFGWFVGLCT